MYNIIAADNVRPLPPRPDINWERKRARKLARVSGEKLKLDEARLLIARGYGFDSWHKLERYYADWELLRRTHSPTIGSLSQAENQVQGIRLEFQNRQQFSVQPPDVSGRGTALCRFVPRFYGRTDEEIFSSTLTVEEAQLVVARGRHCDSWNALMATCANYVETPLPPLSFRLHRMQAKPVTFASMTKGDTDEERIIRLFTDNRCMFKPLSDRSMFSGSAFLWRFLIQAIAGLPDPQEMLQWIRSTGFDLQGHLNILLLGDRIPIREVSDGARPRIMMPQPAMTRVLLDYGANPEWIAPNKFSVLEHAVIRYGSGEAVDVLLDRVKPRKAFWIAAGIGDIDMLQSFFKANGELSQSARRDRPRVSLMDTIPLGHIDRPCVSETHVLWEAFIIAVMNSRLNVIAALLDRGLPVDFTPFSHTALHCCIEYHLHDVAHLLLTRGANPDFRAWPDQPSPREMATSWLKHFPESGTAGLIINQKAAA
ncbi:MAG: ankyrin repeat domain-containing protein [Gemmatimonas sp.]